MRPTRVMVASIAAFMVGLLLPGAAYAALATSDWTFALAKSDSCTWGKAEVDNVNDFARSRTASRDKVGAPPNCTSVSSTTIDAAPGHLQGTAFLIRNSNDATCGLVGPLYNTSTTALLLVRANRYTTSGCPGSNGTAYHAFTVSQRWTGSVYDGAAMVSPSLNFN
jgi:hypothetical protein